MRKYYQAALALTAAVSLIALLFYRHEYNKLRFVLQVFNYFGTPIQKDNNCTISTAIWNNYNMKFLSPESSWQRISDNLHIYSAYNSDIGVIHAIGYGKIIDKSLYTCHIIFDNDIESIIGKFSYEIINEVNNESIKNNDNKYYGYLLICKFDAMNSKIVVGVQFEDITENNLNLLPIIQVETLKHNFNASDNVICLAPPTQGLIKQIDMISFLAFHHYIGWKDFIVYDFGISSVLNNNIKAMTAISDAQLNFTYITIPWNFPYAQISYNTIREIIEVDCIYRTNNKAKMAVTLAWNEYINLRFHHTVENVLSDIANENGNFIINKFRLNTLVYCLNEVIDDLLISTSVISKTTRRLKKVIHNEPHYIFKLVNISSINTITQQDIGDLIYINRYQQCNIEDKREIIENGMLKFAEYVSKTKIFRYYIMGQSFGH